MKKTKKHSLAIDLAQEIILGCDIFDANDIWEIIGDCSYWELKQLEKEIRQYIYKTWPLELGAWDGDFLKRQINYWVYQDTWRYPPKKKSFNWIFTVLVLVAILVLSILLNK